MRLVESASLRRTPAGMPAIRLKVAHASMLEEGGRQRSVEIETEVVAFGPVAERLAQAKTGAQLDLVGFLDRRGANYPHLELHVTELKSSAPVVVGGPETNQE